MRAKRLSREFYQRDTIDVARDLLGKVLVVQGKDGLSRAGQIVETEAYLGVEDPAAHSYGGRRTPRTEPMFAQAGTSYVYFIYGVHFCFNVVTMSEGIPEAVLIRALAPLDNLPTEFNVANGPGKLCAALQIQREQNALDLCTSTSLWLEERDELLSVDSIIVDGPRIGIGDHLDHIHWPLRFGWHNHPALSPRKFQLS